MDAVRNTGTREQKSYSHTESTVKPPLPTLSHMEIPNESKQGSEGLDANLLLFYLYLQRCPIPPPSGKARQP